jgi:hypothetical protein
MSEMVHMARDREAPQAMEMAANEPYYPCCLSLQLDEQALQRDHAKRMYGAKDT